MQKKKKYINLQNIKNYMRLMITIVFLFFAFITIWQEEGDGSKYRLFLWNKITDPVWCILVIIMISIWMLINMVNPQSKSEKKEIIKYKKAVHLGIIGFIIAFFHHFGLTIGMFYVVTFAYFFLNTEL